MPKKFLQLVNGSNSYKLILFSSTIIFLVILILLRISFDNKTKDLEKQITKLSTTNINLNKDLQNVKKELDALKKEDQYVKNQTLQNTITNIENTYTKAVGVYEKLLDLKTISKNTTSFDSSFSKILSLLSQRKYTEANTLLIDISQKIDDEKTKISSTFVIPQNVAQSNTPPASGFSQQTVKSDVGDFLVYIISADLGSTKVIVDTASDTDCSNNCPTLPLADFVSRSGAYAGINGTFFCPTEYPSCAGKTNSFDLLVMNKNKHYFNSDNNVYSTNPAVIFLGGSVRFVSKAQEWGRDTGVDGVLSNFPLLVIGDSIAYDSSSDPKFNSKGPRGFIANKGNTVYIGFVMNATMRDSAHVLKTMGMNNAINLDEGGSTALWSGGYKLGPGRNIANAILFVKK